MLITSNFSFSHCVFKRDVLQSRKNQGLFGKGVKCVGYVIKICLRKVQKTSWKRRKCWLQVFFLSHIFFFFSKAFFYSLFNSFPNKPLLFTCLQYKSFENTGRILEIAHNEQFLLFPQCFLLFWRALCHFHQNKSVVCKHFQFGRV